MWMDGMDKWVDKEVAYGWADQKRVGGCMCEYWVSVFNGVYAHMGE